MLHCRPGAPMKGAVHLHLIRLQQRWRDPLLTTLTVLSALMLFVIAPLQALLVVSGSLQPVVWVLLAIALSVLAAILRIAHSGLALYSDAAAWVILGTS